MQRLVKALSTFVLALFFTLNAGQAYALNVYVTGSSVNLRAQPSTGSAVLGKVKYRQALSHLGKSGSFIKVKAPSGAIGYIHSSLLSSTAPAIRVTYAPTRIAPAAVQSRTVWLNTDSGVYHNSSCRWYNNTKYGEFVKVNNAAGRPCQKCGG